MAPRQPSRVVSRRPGATSRLGQQPEPLAGGSVSEPHVGTDEVVSNGPVGHRDESRAELHRVGDPKRVGSDQAHRSLPQGPERGYLRPGGGELSERGAGGGAPASVKLRSRVRRSRAARVARMPSAATAAASGNPSVAVRPADVRDPTPRGTRSRRRRHPRGSGGQPAGPGRGPSRSPLGPRDASNG